LGDYPPSPPGDKDEDDDEIKYWFQGPPSSDLEVVKSQDGQVNDTTALVIYLGPTPSRTLDPNRHYGVSCTRDTRPKQKVPKSNDETLEGGSTQSTHPEPERQGCHTTIIHIESQI